MKIKKIISGLTALTMLIGGAYSENKFIADMTNGISASAAASAETYADIVVNSYKVYEKEFYSPSSCYVGFFDIDLDGSLEFMLSNTAGSGFFSDIIFYKTDIDNNTVVPMESSVYEGGYIDLASGIQLYKDSDGNMFFVGKNTERAGAGYYGTFTEKFFAKDGVLTNKSIFGEGMDGGKKYYYDAINNKDVSESAYNKLKDSFYGSLTDMNLKYLFLNNIDDPKSFTAMSDDERREFLIKSYNAFGYDGYGNETGKCDIDGDGEITSSDALNILQAVTGLAELNDEQKAAADLDGDGEITSNDALKILQMIVGLA